MGKKRKKRSGWHTSVYAGRKTKTLYKQGKVKARIPIKSSGQGFTKEIKMKGRKR